MAPAADARPGETAFADAAEAVRGLMRAGRPIVGLCAAGILIRILGPLLIDKRVEPPVLAVAEDGSSIVPLLGGHRGANALARRLALALGVTPAITTASDSTLGLALDEPPAGWRLAEPAAAKPFTAALLEGRPARLTVEAGDARWLTAGSLPLAEAAEAEILVTARSVAGGASRLVLHPPVLALGVGAERGAPAAALLDLVLATLAEAGLAPAAVACVTSIDLKADEPAVHALAAALGVPARFFPAAALEVLAPRLANPSATVFATTGCHGVAEGAALAAAGADGWLIVAKSVGARVTCAVAQAPGSIDPWTVGRPQGRLAVVGLGPGNAAGRTRAAEAAITGADHLVGYQLYLDLAADLAPGRARHAFALGQEEARCRHALDLAAAGASVALLASGDPGIYAMASLVFELVDREARADWRRVAIEVVPGVSAMQAASASAGAMLGHDFCAISLSDLMTPWPVIERRLEAAAAGDFVVALYNPVSARRREALHHARTILLAARAGDTPVLIARDLGRPGERCTAVTLDGLEVDQVDMLTTVLVGSRSTRRLELPNGVVRLYTPRGYAVA